MEIFLERLIAERNELEVKVMKLNDFLESPKLDEVDLHHQDLLKLQLHTMTSYLGVLNIRIKDLL